jgi:hypothetical protein
MTLEEIEAYYRQKQPPESQYLVNLYGGKQGEGIFLEGV